MESECCSVEIQVLKAGNESSCSCERSGVRWTETSGLQFGSVNVDIAVKRGLPGGKLNEGARWLASSRDLESM